MENKKFYITTTLPYVNAEPHIGFALEIIQADVIARYQKNLGKDVFFNTGTDEHGLKIYLSAKKEGLEAKKYCDGFAEKNKDLKKALNLSYNNFVRTTDENHIKSAQAFWLKCFDAGDIYKKNYKVKYCVGCELEKTDSELQDGKCPIHPNRDIEIIEEENYFFKYSKYQKPILDFYEKNPNFVIPEGKYNEIKEFTKRGLEDFSISRLKEKMPWGVAVPNDDKHVMYVWFDALENYISVLGWPASAKASAGKPEYRFDDFWPGMQVAGKDNLRQQSSMWQAMLLSAGLSCSKQIFIHGFITVNGQKISKSLGNVINPIELVNKYGTDAVRYYLLREIPSAEDGDFTIEKFEARYNSDLAGGIGNLVARTVTMASKIQVTNYKLQTNPKSQITNSKLVDEITRVKITWKKSLNDFKFNESLIAIWELISWCDKYINETTPWSAKSDEEINKAKEV
ncbi:MAG: methionine--tRNA ligase, partial [Candidatus Staskawiczbacteria bacterium RIFOXYA2_FULL_32_7]